MKLLAGLLCVLLAGCATPQPSSPNPAPSASITLDCWTYCSDVGAILTAVARLGYPVKSVSIVPSLPYDCPVPEEGVTFPPCPPADDPPTAYVTFVGTDKIAHVQVAAGPLNFGDSVYSFEVPPPPDASF